MLESPSGHRGKLQDAEISVALILLDPLEDMLNAGARTLEHLGKAGRVEHESTRHTNLGVVAAAGGEDVLDRFGQRFGRADDAIVTEIDQPVYWFDHALCTVMLAGGVSWRKSAAAPAAGIGRPVM